MKRPFLVFAMLMIAVLMSLSAWARARGPEITDPEEAKKTPDFMLQGEYQGEGNLDGEKVKMGAQVVALGDGGFEIYLLKGGLPGKGWKKGDERCRIEGHREGEVAQLKGEKLSGTLENGKMTLVDESGNQKIELKRIERKSPTLCKKPPKGAIVLFGGPKSNQFPNSTVTEAGNLVSGITSTPQFGGKGYKIHIEFRLSWMPKSRGQGRSNSGVYFHDCYEVQVLDSFGLEGKDNECGGLYKIKAPDVNMCLPPLVWQTYDVDLTAPKYDESGKKVANARITVCHNGVTIHDNLELPNGTPGRKPEGPGPRPLHIQGHGCHVQYRNIWLEEKK